MKRSRLKPISDKRRNELKLYNILRKAYLIEHPICEACNCSKAMWIHHKKGRGIYLCVVEFFMAVCGQCHRWIEDNREDAREKKWLLDRLGNL